ncbi:MAG: hypothetical protein QXG00_06580 [Candidatus Woesearchaeota archaeon]
MLDVNDINVIRPEIKRLFDTYFEDKYSPETRETILEDLIELIRNNMIDEINFCIYDSSVEQIIAGYSFKFITNEKSNYLVPKNIELTKQKLSTTTEKFLIIKLNEKEINNPKLNELTNKWDFLKQPVIKIKPEKRELLWVKDTKIELQEINNG